MQNLPASPHVSGWDPSGGAGWSQVLPALWHGPRRLRASVGGRAGQPDPPSAGGHHPSSCQSSPSCLQKLCKHQETQVSSTDLSTQAHQRTQPGPGHKELTFKHQFPSFFFKREQLQVFVTPPQHGAVLTALAHLVSLNLLSVDVPGALNHTGKGTSLPSDLPRGQIQHKLTENSASDVRQHSLQVSPTARGPSRTRSSHTPARWTLRVEPAQRLFGIRQRNATRLNVNSSETGCILTRCNTAHRCHGSRQDRCSPGSGLSGAGAKHQQTPARKGIKWGAGAALTEGFIGKT